MFLLSSIIRHHSWPLASAILPGVPAFFVRTATSQSAGSTRNGRSSRGKRLGIKKYAGEHVIPGNILVRQRGTPIRAGQHVGMGRDHTLWTLIEGFVRYEKTPRVSPEGRLQKERCFVHVFPTREEAVAPGATVSSMYRPLTLVLLEADRVPSTNKAATAVVAKTTETTETRP
jgi:large subunit ribosomal protein L27